MQVYGRQCLPDQPTDCVYYNPLSLTPKSGPSYLQARCKHASRQTRERLMAEGMEAAIY